MKIVRLKYPLTLSFHPEPTSMAIGFFDGVHLGHQKVIGEAMQYAKYRGLQTSVMTFHPHPREVFGNKEYASYITPLEYKLDIFRDMGVDVTYVVTFDEYFAKVSPADFVEQFLVPLRIQSVTVGFDFSFGFQGLGKVQDLKAFSKSRFRVKEIPAMNTNTQKISSTLIRKKMHDGKIEEINRYLGREYTIYGKLHQDNFRKFNLLSPSILPRMGSYKVRIKTVDQSYLGRLHIIHSSYNSFPCEWELRLDGEDSPEIRSKDILQVQFIESQHVENGMDSVALAVV